MQQSSDPVIDIATFGDAADQTILLPQLDPEQGQLAAQSGGHHHFCSPRWDLAMPATTFVPEEAVTLV